MPKKLTLDDDIERVLQEVGKPLTRSQIHSILQTKGIWRRPKDGKPPRIQQVATRVRENPIFTISEDGEVSLVDWENDRRLLRIAWNENNWEKPSRHKWSKRNQGNTNKAFENQYGFAGEEWLFNARYNIDGFQYGYFREFENTPGGSTISEAYLFTINPKTKDRLLVGSIDDIEVLDFDELSKAVVKVFENSYDEVRTEIEEAGGDVTGLNGSIMPVVRFKMSNVFRFEIPPVVNQLAEGNRFNRYKAYHLTEELEQILSGTLEPTGFQFHPGRRKSEHAEHTRSFNEKSVDIPGLHAEIISALEKFLSPDYLTSKKNISIEKTTCGQNIADIVLQENPNTYSILEVKTSSNGRKNIREAIGQLLDYACWDGTIEVRRLIVVSPAELTADLKSYFERLRKVLKFKLEYWHYQKKSNIKAQFIRS